MCSQQESRLHYEKRQDTNATHTSRLTRNQPTIGATVSLPTASLNNQPDPPLSCKVILSKMPLEPTHSRPLALHKSGCSSKHRGRSPRHRLGSRMSRPQGRGSGRNDKEKDSCPNREQNPSLVAIFLPENLTNQLHGAHFKKSKEHSLKHASGPYPQPEESNPHPPSVSFRFYLIPFSHLRLGLRICLHTKMLHAFPISRMRVTFSVHPYI
jgi:hypothetical protein